VNSFIDLTLCFIQALKVAGASSSVIDLRKATVYPFLPIPTPKPASSSPCRHSIRRDRSKFANVKLEADLKEMIATFNEKFLAHCGLQGQKGSTDTTTQEKFNIFPSSKRMEWDIMGY
jgi:hypothetical protein